MKTQPQTYWLLRRALQANGAFSLLSSIIRFARHRAANYYCPLTALLRGTVILECRDAGHQSYRGENCSIYGYCLGNWQHCDNYYGGAHYRRELGGGYCCRYRALFRHRAI